MTVELWPREQILQAIRDWTDLHGRAPSKRDWLKASYNHPSYETVRVKFGSVEAARRAAGVVFLRCNQAGVWGRDEILDAIFRWRFEKGELPRANEWKVSVDGYPTEWWVRREFGSWNAAIVAAGYEPRFPRRNKHSYRASISAIMKERAAA